MGMAGAAVEIGEQTIQLVFDKPGLIQRIWLASRPRSITRDRNGLRRRVVEN
jgi:hypothetical protein